MECSFNQLIVRSTIFHSYNSMIRISIMDVLRLRSQMSVWEEALGESEKDGGVDGRIG